MKDAQKEKKDEKNPSTQRSATTSHKKTEDSKNDKKPASSKK